MLMAGLSLPAEATANTAFNVTVSAGTTLLPGMVVSLAAGTGGSASFGGGTATVVSVSGTTATLTAPAQTPVLQYQDEWVEDQR